VRYSRGLKGSGEDGNVVLSSRALIPVALLDCMHENDRDAAEHMSSWANASVEQTVDNNAT
jgi:hypothetical protein